MRRLKNLAVLVLLPAVLALMLVACSGSDDKKDDAGGDNGSAVGQDRNSDSNKDNGDSKDGGDSKSGGDIVASGDTGSDAKYVAAVCKGARTFMDDMLAAFSKMDFTKFDPNDPNAAVKLMEPFTATVRAFGEEMAKASPPKDLQSWHNELVENFNEMVQALESGDEARMDAIGDVDFPDMPEDIAQRLAKHAEKNADCQALEDETGEGIFTAGE